MVRPWRSVHSPDTPTTAREKRKLKVGLLLQCIKLAFYSLHLAYPMQNKQGVDLAYISSGVRDFNN
jgi:hypothetical protein